MRTLENMPGHTRLYRRGAVYYHRAAIPKDIADTYPKTEETFSLKTKDHAEALRRVRIEAVRVDEKFEAHRRRLEAEIGEKQARSIKCQMTIAKPPLAKEGDEFSFEDIPVKASSLYVETYPAADSRAAMLSSAGRGPNASM